LDIWKLKSGTFLPSTSLWHEIASCLLMYC